MLAEPFHVENLPFWGAMFFFCTLGSFPFFFNRDPLQKDVTSLCGDCSGGLASQNIMCIYIYLNAIKTYNIVVCIFEYIAAIKTYKILLHRVPQLLYTYNYKYQLLQNSSHYWAALPSPF